MIKSARFLSILLIALTCQRAAAQNLYYKTYNWEKQPKVYAPAAAEKTDPYIRVKDKTVTEAVYEKDGSAVVYETHHIIIHLNDGKAIDKVNKVHISTRGVYEEIDLKARCITADNKVIPFNKDDVKKVENLDDRGPFTIFPIDGVEAGCDVEYMFTNKRHFVSYSMYNAQTSIPVVSYEYTVITPKNLVMETKCYNGLSPFVKETADTTKNTLTLKEANLEGFEAESYSSSEAEKKSFLVQLAYNTNNNNAKLYTWETISSQYYNTLFNAEKADQKIIEKLVNKNKLNQGKDEEQKIKALESFIKTNYLISNDVPDLTLAKALDEKKLTESNALLVFITALKYMEIPFELVLTTDRHDTKFDPKMPSYSYTNEVLLYFPGIGKYTSPLNIYSRTGYPTNNSLLSSGLYVKEISVGDIKSSSSKVKAIPGNDYKESYHNMTMKANLNFADQLVSLDVTQMLKGYLAYYTQPIYRYFDDNNKKEYQESVYLIPKTESVKNFTVTNYGEEDLFVKPLVVSYSQETSELLENAGNKYILKLGEMIGQQSELYSDKKRKTEGDIYYSHYLKREIEINIPAGYKITNPDDIIIKKKCVMNDKDAAQFESSYKLENNKLTVTVYEDYREIFYPLKDFDAFKSVINAAADFNKKTLVFEKIN